MPKKLIIGNEVFDFPLQGENSDYGESITDWATAVTEALETVQQPNDILTTSAAINNNQLTFTNIPSFTFDTTEVIAIEAEYIVIRSTQSPQVQVTESGKLEGNFNGVDWVISQSYDGEAEIEFNITSSGQVQYKTNEMVGLGYVGQIIFKARVFNQFN